MSAHGGEIFTLPRWIDFHTHFRQGENTPDYIADHVAMGCTGALAMPNTLPPAAIVSGKDKDSARSLEGYRAELMQGGADRFEHLITPLYLTSSTTPAMIEELARKMDVPCAKYYPPHGTTNSQSAAPFDHYIQNGVFAAMENNGVILNIHGEAHDIPASRYFDEAENAEDIFYRTQMPALAEKFPKLKIVCEHITTRVAASFVTQTPDNVAATITPQHLLYTVGDLLRGLNYHLYCLPLVKFEADRAALLAAVVKDGQIKFFAGTDSAPHTTKTTPCGCAAGCYTGGIAPQLYAEAFDLKAETLPAYRAFLCENGPDFYNLKPSEKTMTLTAMETQMADLALAKDVLSLPEGMGRASLGWTLRLD